MKSSESSHTLKSFKDLKVLVEKETFLFPECAPVKPPEQMRVVIDPEKEQQLFQDAMADVTPLTGHSRIECNPQARVQGMHHEDTDAETLVQLEKLVKHGEGFVLAYTPEYIEGIGHRVHPNVSKRLHRGDFSIQAHIDLHGLSVESAGEAFEKFLRDAIASGKRAVSIVHGRGLSSPSKPVLKTKVYEWLTSGPWRKWIIAFSSARPCDGGAGATYVLLRNRPLTKRFRKRKSACPKR
jgi:DNA-nicking Smr family endonuclease